MRPAQFAFSLLRLLNRHSADFYPWAAATIASSRTASGCFVKASYKRNVANTVCPATAFAPVFYIALFTHLRTGNPFQRWNRAQSRNAVVLRHPGPGCFVCFQSDESIADDIITCKGELNCQNSWKRQPCDWLDTCRRGEAVAIPYDTLSKRYIVAGQFAVTRSQSQRTDLLKVAVICGCDETAVRQLCMDVESGVIGIG